jgi:hypothetical protein
MLDMLYSMPDERAAGQMREMVRGLTGLDEEQHRRIVDVRTAVLAGFPPQKRLFLLRAHQAACRQLPPALTERETALTRAALEALPPERRQAIQAQLTAALAG